MKPGDIILISHPYTDFTSIKIRPALVVSSKEYNQKQADVILIPISSKVDVVTTEDIIIKSDAFNFSNTGLKKSSIIKCGKIFTAEKTLAKRYLGYIPIEMLKKVQQVLKTLFSIT